uniref:Uncharacterized protein n=1 Tax=Timema cristinae TaxID=61476 RepID=A0A7R9DDA6_TIMCR|nr:unnamed protein product [Timema cristinae]
MMGETPEDYIIGLGNFSNVFLPKSVYYLECDSPITPAFIRKSYSSARGPSVRVEDVWCPQHLADEVGLSPNQVH